MLSLPPALTDGSDSEAVAVEDSEAFGDEVGGQGFVVDEFLWRACDDPGSGNDGTDGENVGLAFFSGPSSDTVKICRRPALRCMKQEMAQFVKENGEFFRSGQFAVNHNKILP